VSCESANRRLGLQLTVRAMKDLDARAVINFLEGVGNGAELRGKLLARQAGDVDNSFDELNVGNGLLAELSLGGFWQGRLGVGHIFKINLFQLTLATDTEDHRGGVRALAARQREVDFAADRVDLHVVDLQLLRVDAQQRGYFAVETLDVDAAVSFAGLAVADVNGEDGGALRIADE